MIRFLKMYKDFDTKTCYFQFSIIDKNADVIRVRLSCENKKLVKFRGSKKILFFPLYDYGLEVNGDIAYIVEKEGSCLLLLKPKDEIISKIEILNKVDGVNVKLYEIPRVAGIKIKREGTDIDIKLDKF